MGRGEKALQQQYVTPDLSYDCIYIGGSRSKKDKSNEWDGEQKQRNVYLLRFVAVVH